MAPGSGYSLTDPDPQHDFETRLDLQQPLFDPDRYYTGQRARLAARAARAASRWSEEEAALAALRAYLEVQRAEAADTWVHSSQQEAEEILRLASERHAAGLGLKADELRARVFLAETRRYAVASENDIHVARQRLAQAIGRDGVPVEIAAPLTEGDFPPSGDGDGHLEQRADLEAAALRSAGSETGVQQARAAWLPRAGVQASYAWHDETTPFGTDSASWGVLVGAQWELFDGLRRPAADKRAKAEYRAAEAERREATEQSRLQLVEARLRSEEARLQLELARQALGEADESSRLLRQRYEAGLTDLADVLAAQSALDRARFDAVAAETRLLAARAQVAFEQGLLLQTFLTVAEENKP